MDGAMSTLSIGNLAMNLFLAAGFKFLWNMVTLLQFVIFMRFWLIPLPDQVDMLFKTLKSLALFEFLPTEDIKIAIFDLLGMEEENLDD